MRSRTCLGSIAAFVALAPIVVSAQMGMGAGGSGANYGIMVGTNVSTVSEAERGVGVVASAAYDKTKRIGLNAGVFLNVPLFGGLSLQPEAHYSQQGVTLTQKNTTNAAKATFKVDYAEVPLLLRLDLAKGSFIHPVLYGGASGAFRVTCDIDLTAGSTSTKQSCSENTTSTSKDPITKYDVSAIGGAGFAVNALGRSYTLTGRYTQGLSNISTATAAGSSTAKHSVVSILLSMGF